MEAEGLRDPVAAALAVNSPSELSAYLIDLAERARSGMTPVENQTSPDLIEAGGYWAEGIVAFLRARDTDVENVSPWAITAMVISAALIYE